MAMAGICGGSPTSAKMPLHALPRDLQAHQLPGRAFALLALERAAADEVALLVQAHRPVEPELVGRGFLPVDPGVVGRVVVDLDHEEPGLDPRHVHRQDAAGHQAVVVAGDDQRVPDRERVGVVHPDLEAEVAGVAGARDRHRVAGQRVLHQAEVLERVERLRAAAVEDRARLRALQAQRRDLVGDLGDLDVQAHRVHRQPAQRRLGRGHAEALLGQARDGAVVEHLALVVAPAGVVDLPHRHLEHVAGRDPVQQARGVGPLDQVLHQRRDVDQRRRVADRPVLAVEPEVVGTRP